MKLINTSRKLHKWLMLFLGIQFLIWSISGAFMVILDIHYIHGDSLVNNPQVTIKADSVQFPLAKVIAQYPQAKEIALDTFLGQSVYHFKQGKEKYMLSALDGALLSPISEQQAIATAKFHYTGSGEVASVTLITENPPSEVRASIVPAWRVDFDDFANPSIYISAQQGTLVGKRHDNWRIFDVMFALHVMDYQGQEVDNKLLFWFVLFSLLAAIVGAILSYFVIFKTGSKASAISQQQMGAA